MAADTYSHDNYVDAFQQFMQTGNKDKLSPFLENSRPADFLSVYRNGFIRASASALESNFPCLVKLWGEDYFTQVATAYVNIAPPSAATLLGYGFDNTIVESPTPSFIQFLQRDLTEVIDDYPYVPDICRLDQAWSESLNENGDSFLTLESVQNLVAEGMDLGELPLTLVNSCRIVDLKYDIFELWGQLRFSELSEDNKIELIEQENSILFWQIDLQVQAKPLSTAETAFMQSLKKEPDFDIANNHALEEDENFDLSALFAELLNAQLLRLPPNLMS